MIHIISKDKRYNNRLNWLNAYWLFSFSHYQDPDNVRWGSLRVFNDDVIEPEGGFSEHHHENYEIITIVLDGELTHKDNTKGKDLIIGKNEVQVMSTGKGITHAEFNEFDQPLHLYQIWIIPNKKDIEPIYQQKLFSAENWQNKLLPLVSDKGENNSIKINADASIYRAVLDKDKTIEFSTDKSKKVFIYLTGGELCINGNILNKNDQARIYNEQVIKLKGRSKADFILIETADV